MTEGVNRAKLFQNQVDAPQDDGQPANGPVMLDTTRIAHDQPPTIAHPRETPLHLPTAAVTRACAERPPAFRPSPVALNHRDGGLDAPPSPLLAEGLTIIPLIGDYLLRACARPTARRGDLGRGQGRRGQRLFTRVRTRHLQSDRQTMAIRDRHHLRALADFGLPNTGAPLWAGTQLPSRKACAHASLPWASNGLNSARHLRAQVPSRDQARKRRPQVAGEP